MSLATVDRVLNQRPGVRAVTIAKVQGAVQRLGYVRDAHAANLARGRRHRFAFVLPSGAGQFAKTLHAALMEAYASPLADRIELTVLTVSPHDPHAVANTLKSQDLSKLDGVALMVQETPQVRDAVAALKRAGLAVVALVSDLPSTGRDYFVGINSVAAGRTAAQLIGGLIKEPAEILCVTNALRSRDSLERRLGFDAAIAAYAPGARVLPTVEAFDDPARMADAVTRVAQSRPALAAIYSMGSGNAALLAALGSARQGGRVVVAHELTPVTRAGLATGALSALIVQDVGHLVRSALRVLRSLRDDVPIVAAQERIRIEIVMRENLQ